MKEILPQKLSKPRSFPKYGVIAVYDYGTVSVNERDVMDMPYNVSQLAINRVTNKLQSYVTSNTLTGIKLFIKDFPQAELRHTASLTSPEEWETLAFPNERIEKHMTPLDGYFQAVGKQLANAGRL